MPLTPALERNIRWEETVLMHSLILRFLEAGSPFWTKVEVRASGYLFCFSDLQVEPPVSVFVYHASDLDFRAIHKEPEKPFS